MVWRGFRSFRCRIRKPRPYRPIRQMVGSGLNAPSICLFSRVRESIAFEKKKKSMRRERHAESIHANCFHTLSARRDDQGVITRVDQNLDDAGNKLAATGSPFRLSAIDPSETVQAVGDTPETDRTNASRGSEANGLDTRSLFVFGYSMIGGQFKATTPANRDRLHQVFQSYGLDEPGKWQYTFIQTGHSGQEESSDESVSTSGPSASFRVGKTLPPHSTLLSISSLRLAQQGQT